MKLLTARQVAPIVGLGERRISELAQEGKLPGVPYGKQRRFDLDAVRASISALSRRTRPRTGDGLLQCYVCKRWLAEDKFLAIVVKDKRCQLGHSLETISSDCRECRNEQKREWRRRKAEAAGRTFEPRGDRGEWEARMRDARERRKLERRAAWALCLAFWALVRLSPEDRRKRVNAQKTRWQREQYNSNPVYQAKIKAKKIRRKRAMRDTQIVPVNREAVAQRDGWLCGICGGKVTRATWSLDHIIPLSKGGSHTYDNVALAHLSCNVKRGAGRLPVQAPLFSRIPAPDDTSKRRATPPGCRFFSGRRRPAGDEGAASHPTKAPGCLATASH